MSDQIVKTVNHWGKWVSSDVPVTGVLNSNSIAWEFVNDEICLTCEKIYDDILNDESIEDEYIKNQFFIKATYS
jgi:hypothetical protein